MKLKRVQNIIKTYIIRHDRDDLVGVLYFVPILKYLYIFPTLNHNCLHLYSE